MKSIITFTALLLLAQHLWAQDKLTQNVRGTLLDTDSKNPLIGATIIVLNSEPFLGAVTDFNGQFRIENVPAGRITLQLSYMGYEPKTIPGIVVNSAKEVVLELTMEESAVQMDAIVVTANPNKGEAINEMAIVSARSISPEETSRYAGGFNDPSRIMSNFAGITNTQDGSNDIIVRGNSPKYVQWRLEGVQITNPNHFAEQNASMGGVSTLNNNMLAASDFYTGAFTPEFGDVMSGVYDVRLRAGNNERTEAMVGVGLIGTEMYLEGPFKKGYGGSYIANYRYATVGLISELGLVDMVGIPKFQDASFKMVLPAGNLGTFSLFGLAGNSKMELTDVKPSFWETPGDRALKSEISEDYEKVSYLLNTGLNHTISTGKNSFINSTLSYSVEGIDDEVFESRIVSIYNGSGQFLSDSVVDRLLNFDSELIKTSYRGAVTFNAKLNAKHKIQVGTKFSYLDYQFKQTQFTEVPEDRATLVDFKENVSTLGNFISWKYRVNENITLVTGLHNMNVLYNSKSTIEPRFSMNWNIDPANSIHAGYGHHSTMETIHNYFAKVEEEDGTITEPNKDLGLLKARHYVLGYERRIGSNLKANVELYYQDLYDLPVENSDTSHYSTINEGLEFRYVDLVNEGTGKNYGVEVTLERFFSKNYYFLINASLYESKYTSLEKIERNTRYSGNYLFNILVGKEFTNLGKNQNQTLGLNAKVFFAGSQKIIPLLRDDQGNLAVDPDNNMYWDYDKAYVNGLDDLYQVILSASYKWNKLRATHELYLNLDNLTNQKGRISEYYDDSEPNDIGYLTQFGFFPNLMYRVYF